MNEYKKLFEEYARGNRITKSVNSFKVALFLKKGENSPVDNQTH